MRIALISVEIWCLDFIIENKEKLKNTWNSWYIMMEYSLSANWKKKKKKKKKKKRMRILSNPNSWK